MTGPCEPGSYCTLGATIKAPRDNTTGNICPAGSYCTEGTAAPMKCMPGTYSTATENKKMEDCSPCDEGQFCSEWGLTAPNGNCSAGFYCPKGQNSSQPEEFRCTPGHYCPPASKAELPCTSGSFQNEFYKNSCKPCPERYFCNGLILNDTHCSHGVQIPEDCPQGYYCRPLSNTGKEHGCPIGRYFVMSVSNFN